MMGRPRVAAAKWSPQSRPREEALREGACDQPERSGLLK
jgi:hypothetical protein